VELLTVAEVARMLSASKSFVYDLAARRQIASYKIGQGAVRFRFEDVVEYLDRCRVEAGGVDRRPSRPAGVTFQHLDPSRLAAAWRERAPG